MMLKPLMHAHCSLERACVFTISLNKPRWAGRRHPFRGKEAETQGDRAARASLCAAGLRHSPLDAAAVSQPQHHTPSPDAAREHSL